MRCPSCDTENPPDARFCGKCGSSLSQELSCRNCGRVSPLEVSFCHGCGQRLDQAASPAPSPTPQPGPALPASFANGRYDVRRFLGGSGRKRVYLARDTRLDRDVAVAMIKTEGLDADRLARVQREAQSMARLGDHPHIVNVFDIGEEKGPDGRGQPYIVSQYMSGGELGDRLDQAEGRRLGLAEALRISNDVRLALEHAHGEGIIHRDLKPANIWLTKDGTTKLGDFGLAAALERWRGLVRSEVMMVGTVAYMSPEQALDKPADARSDIYSLGCVLYEMVTGRPPFLGDDDAAIISQHINTAPVAPSWHNADLPWAVDALIMRCLAKDPEERPESAAAIPDVLLKLTENAGRSIDTVASLVYAEKPDLRSQTAPDGTVTILFSDIEGSTAKTEELGDQRWMEVLREHNAIVRAQLAAHDGFEVKSEGDGFMLAFQSARKALQFAIETQKAFAERAESAEEAIQVRMGLHTGEVIKEGDDFFGNHVNLAARIAGEAIGGEILVSSLLNELTSGGGDIEFGDPREVELKGLTGVQEMFPVYWQSA